MNGEIGLLYNTFLLFTNILTNKSWKSWFNFVGPSDKREKSFCFGSKREKEKIYLLKTTQMKSWNLVLNVSNIGVQSIRIILKKQLLSHQYHTFRHLVIMVSRQLSHILSHIPNDKMDSSREFINWIIDNWFQHFIIPFLVDIYAVFVLNATVQHCHF